VFHHGKMKFSTPILVLHKIKTGVSICFRLFEILSSFAPVRRGWPKPVVLFLIQFLLKSEGAYEKQAVNRLTICIVFVVSMSQKQLIETTSPTIDLHDLFPK
jgi:hypothetical protein